MNDLNVWTGVGRLGRDAEPSNGNGPARFSIAVNRSVKRDDNWTDEASWIDCEYWHKSLLPYLLKGKQVAIRGELRQERWEDRATGSPRSKIVIVVQDIQLLGGTREEGQGQAQTSPDARRYSEPPPRPAPATASQSRELFKGKPEDDFTDDIPF